MVFLDLGRDRYFSLPASLEDAFRTFVDPQRYSEGAIDALLRAALIRPATAPRLAEPAKISPPVHSWEPGKRARLTSVLRAISLEMYVGSRLRRGRIARLIELLQDRNPSRQTEKALSNPLASEIITAFSDAKLYRSPAGRCLSRSLALASQLASRGCASNLVIGVRAEPFAAHCWVQADLVVLNDTAEEVRRYTPILVI